MVRGWECWGVMWSNSDCRVGVGEAIERWNPPQTDTILPRSIILEMNEH